jgi:hypothetical protein
MIGVTRRAFAAMVRAYPNGSHPAGSTPTNDHKSTPESGGCMHSPTCIAGGHQSMPHERRWRLSDAARHTAA